MKTHRTILPSLSGIIILCLTTAMPVQASPAVILPALHKNAPVEFTGRKKRTLDYFAIAKDPSITLRKCSDITIFCCDLHSITLDGCENIRIQNCWIHDSDHNGVMVMNCKNIIVQGCRIENIKTGMYAQGGSGLVFEGNFTRNVTGPFPRGQMVQFNNVTGAGNAIRDNFCINDLGKSKPEDVINLYQSQGTAESPILIEGNFLMGDPDKGSAGKSSTGSGIMLGDHGGAHLTARKNIVINAGQCGIGVAGGSNMRVEENLVFGTVSEVSNVGIYAWNQSGKEGGPVEIMGNRVSWRNKNNYETSWWKGSGFSGVNLTDNQLADATLQNSLPPPPTHAPMPPRPVITTTGMKPLVQLPWK